MERDILDSSFVNSRDCWNSCGASVMTKHTEVDEGKKLHVFDLIPKALKYGNRWYYFSCGTERAWYSTTEGSLLEIPNGFGYDSMQTAAEGNLELAIIRLHRLVQPQIDNGNFKENDDE